MEDAEDTHTHTASVLVSGAGQTNRVLVLDLGCVGEKGQAQRKKTDVLKERQERCGAFARVCIHILYILGRE